LMKENSVLSKKGLTSYHWNNFNKIKSLIENHQKKYSLPAINLRNWY
jgi:hypothetical protein